MKSNWNYPTTMWVGKDRIKDLSIACKTLNMSKPLLVTDNGLVKSKIIVIFDLLCLFFPKLDQYQTFQSAHRLQLGDK